jgi:hypothetical protein
LIGGWAVGLYGYPRATKDIDFLIAIEKDNLKKMVKALSDFGGPTTEAKHLSKPGSVFRMGSPPVQIDIINKASGIDFDDCYKRKNIIRVDNIVITVISKDDLIVNKKASGRIQDEADASKLT